MNPPVMISVIENISHSTANMGLSAIMHVEYSFGCNSEIQRFRTYVYIFISCFGVWNSCPKLDITFQ
jgi:hypothetical protein